MNYGKGDWPCWTLDEITEAEISKFLQKCTEKPETEVSQDFKWLQSFIPPSSQPISEDECEWESDDDDFGKFPESLSPLAAPGADRSLEKDILAPGVYATTKDNSKGLLTGADFKGVSAVPEKYECNIQQGLNLKHILQAFNEEKFSNEKKLTEMRALETAEISVLITFIEEASLSIKHDEKKSNFCALMSQLLKDRTFLLGRNFYLPWFQNSGKKDSIPAASLSQTINLFYEQACEDVLLPLLNSAQSGLVEDPATLKDILAFCDPECWLFLLRKFIVLLNEEKLNEWHLPALELLCHQTEELSTLPQTESVINELADLLLSSAVDFSEDRYFGRIILLLIRAVTKHQMALNIGAVTSRLSSILQFHKGPVKFKANNLLKKLMSAKLV